ncbi:MAG: DUF4221 domain-containing protein [Tannerellaceae bacterium]|jgi:hypothetical protein|nr:DUF4221 domain-containing protein [Tannerellaceae bacterium]
MKICFIYTSLSIAMLVSCTDRVATIKNEKAGKLVATHQLTAVAEKRIFLDDDTAPQPPYMQMIEDVPGMRILTFLNPHNQSVYLYDYDTERYIKKISYEKEGPDGILNPAGYYIKNMDSIYVYNMPLIELVLTDSAAHVKDKISFYNKEPDWALYNPQYLFSTTCPMINTGNRLVLPGMVPFSFPDTLIDKFRFTTHIDLGTGRIEYHNTYPEKLYGHNYNWNDVVFTQAYPALSPTGEIIFSFPVSHNLYVTKPGTDDYTTVYAGSNVARTIRSIDREQRGTPSELIWVSYLQQDTYSAILYDPWRHVYYRFMEQGIPDATTATQAKEKPIIIILMDELFNYMGETAIGTGSEWNWKNSFATEEGLNIEYIDNKDLDEAYLNFKIFKIQSL